MKAINIILTEAKVLSRKDFTVNILEVHTFRDDEDGRELANIRYDQMVKRLGLKKKPKLISLNQSYQNGNKELHFVHVKRNPT